MRGTGFLTAAYDNGMEILLLLFLLSTLDKNSDLKQTLQSFLHFYRENRELISLLTGSGAPAEAQSAAAPPAEEKKSRSPQEGRNDSMKILEDFLLRNAGQ